MGVRNDYVPPVEAEQVYRNADGSVTVERFANAAPAASPAQRPARRPSLAAVIIDAGLATYQDISAALTEGSSTGERLGEVLIRHGRMTEEQLAELLATQWSLPYLAAATIAPVREAVDRLPLEQARELDVLPVHFAAGRLVVAVAEPSDERFARARAALADAAFALVGRTVLTQLLEDPFAPPPAAQAPATRLAAGLVSIAAEVEQLEAELAAARRELADLRTGSERTIARLEDALSMRDDLLGVLRAKIADLNGE